MLDLNDHATARLAYEVIAGRVSDNHWYRVRKLLQRHRLEVTTANVQFFANVRQLVPRSAIGVDGILDCYRRADELLSRSNRVFNGSEILGILRTYGVRPHQTTVSRWFRPLGGYRRDREYKPEQLKGLLTQAFLYKAHSSIGLPEVNHG